MKILIEINDNETKLDGLATKKDLDKMEHRIIHAILEDDPAKLRALKEKLKISAEKLSAAIKAAG